MQRGIDISEHQGNVNFAKVNQAVDFVILRDGYGTIQDKRFFEYSAGCQKNNIPIKGVYHFSYALSDADALSEAKFCINSIIKAGIGKDITVFYDFEYDTVAYAKKKGITLGKSQCIAFTKVFCDYVESQGYKAGVYCNIDYYKNMYDKATLSKYVFWLAHYNNGAAPAYTCTYHQYTSSGKISGISGNVDMNIYYGETEEKKMSNACRVLKTKGCVITSPYGQRSSGWHAGVDIVGTGSTLDTITAHSDGTVVWVQHYNKNDPHAAGNASYGNAVKIQHANGYNTLYAHMSRIDVTQGQKVKKGQAIGYMGNTGHSFGAHLHFEVRKGTGYSTTINPQPYLNADLPGTATNINALAVDGCWGSKTTRRLQQIFGTPADGIVSNQHIAYKDKNPGLCDGWEWHAKPNGNGSQLIKAIQKKVGAKQDGQIGPETIKAMQKHYGTKQDGCISKTSSLVMALQKWANNQK